MPEDTSWAKSQPLHRHDLTAPSSDAHTDAQYQIYHQQFFNPTLSSRSEIQQQSVANPQSSPSKELGLRSAIRKPAPSPLQTSTTAVVSPNVTPTRSAFSVRENPPQKNIYDSPPSLEQPKSPKERLDDLLALGRNLSVKAPEIGSLSFENKARPSASITERLNGQSRSASDPIQPRGSSLNSQRPPIPDTATQRVSNMARGPVRTSSIDSAISNMSAQDSQGSATDIANLVQAAGSPEAVIQYLLKEKQSSAAQNAQLWRLVDKQRAMILGLNKDLERALKDKERYRKKLKDSLAQVSTLSASGSSQTMASDNMSETSVQDSQRTDSRQSNVEALVSAGLRESAPESEEGQHSPIDVALAPYPITPPANHSAAPSPSLMNLVEAENKMPEASKHAFDGFDADAPSPGAETGLELKDVDEIEPGLPYNASLPPSRKLPADPPRKSPTVLSKASAETPTVSLTESTPQIEQERTFASPTRKAPPAPLNLGNSTIASTHLHQAGESKGEESDSDYDDILEVDEIPAFTERGRRKTREDDERQRELAAQRDAELRSLSKKSPKTGSNKGTPKEMNPEDAMPGSPRTIQIAPPAEYRQRSGSDAIAGSLAGMLSASLEPDSGFTQQVQEVIAPPMSPGLPLSPRAMASPLPRNPRESPNNSSIASPPMSPRSLAILGSAMPLSPRAPRQPIPLPPGTPMSLASPGFARGEGLQLVSPKPLMISKKANGRADSRASNNTPSPVEDTIYRGFVSEEYPGLLLPPNALPSIEVKVASSRLKPSRASMISPAALNEDPVFTLAVFARADGKELWRVEKDSMSLAQLDQQLKQSSQFTAKTPERQLFSGHAPAKVDARRAALDRYWDEVLNTQMDMPMAMELCRYLSTNTMEPRGADQIGSDSPFQPALATGPGGRPVKNGYLTKRGKNFGGWKARFFVLNGPILKYYESPGGAHLGAIKLQNAQIGKQQQQAEPQSATRATAEDVDNQYRHAFLILEPKRKDSSSLVRHVLCAESDEERDQWVEALLKYVDFKDEEEDQKDQAARRAGQGSRGSNRDLGNGPMKKKGHGSAKPQAAEAEDALRGVSYDTTVPGEVPRTGGRSRSRTTGTPSPPTHGNERDPIAQHQASKQISGPKNAQVIQDTGSWGNKPGFLAPVDDRKQQKKRSFFGFGMKPRASSEALDSNSSLSQMSLDMHGPIRPAFGAPLSEAVRYCHPVDVNIELPAVIYRCIEYLDAKNAQNEEGIFRLSGSNVVIKQLRERFNTEGDVNLVTDDTYYDIHAVASLLKLFLRELPSTILTRELHIEFLAVTELSDQQEKVRALNGLVHRLPRVNEALLRYLSGFLINIINHSDVNKMTVRNVGIVFSPTLNIPAPVFALFLQQYDGIFGDPIQDSPVEVTVTAPALTPEDIRSPRRQKFQDLPTPSYEQQSFSQSQQQYNSQRQQPRSGPYEQTGFSPMQQSYNDMNGGYQTMGGPEYGSRAPTMAGPSYEQYSGNSSKNKRRESSMLLMGGVSQGPPRAMRSATNLSESSFYE